MSLSLEFWHLLLVCPTILVVTLTIFCRKQIWACRVEWTIGILIAGTVASAVTGVVMACRDDTPAFSAEWADLYDAIGHASFYETRIQAIRVFVKQHPDNEPKISPQGLNMFLKRFRKDGSSNWKNFYEASKLISPYLEPKQLTLEKLGEKK